MVWVSGSGKWPCCHKWIVWMLLFRTLDSRDQQMRPFECGPFHKHLALTLSRFECWKVFTFFLLSVLTLYNDQVQSFPSILNTSFLFTFVFQAHDQAVTGLSLHATGNLILSTVLTLMLILSLILYFYKSACTRSSIGTPARSPNWPVFSFQIVFCLLMKQKKNFIWNYLISTCYLGDHFLHSYMARMFIKLVAV